MSEGIESSISSKAKRMDPSIIAQMPEDDRTIIVQCLEHLLEHPPASMSPEEGASFKRDVEKSLDKFRRFTNQS